MSQHDQGTSHSLRNLHSYRTLRLWPSLLLAVLGGLGLFAAAPSLAWWPMAILGAALVISAVWEQPRWRGLGIGAVAGAAYWLPLIHWLTLYLGPVPWLALSAFMIAWFALFGLAAALATRGIAYWFARLRRGEDAGVHRFVALQFAAQVIAVAGLWVAREQVQSTWPYGGFAWGRLAHSQAEGPLVSLVSWVGFAGLSGLLALAAALLAGAWRSGAFRAKSAGLVALGTVAALALLALVPPAPLESSGTLRVGAVQGNSKSGIFDDRQNGDVFAAHLEATEAMLDQAEENGERFDVIVWPENSGEFQLPDQYYRALAVQQLAQRAGAPIVVGTVLQDPDETYTNSVVVFDAQGVTSLRYDKRRPVPFAEYMPNREFFHLLAPDLVDLVQLDYAFGTRSATLPLDTPSAAVRAGIAICFDIIFDDQAVAMMQDDAEVILAPTNNADFGQTDESAQQLQIARLRAVELGRSLVNISTVGTSAVVLPDGTLKASIIPFTAGSMAAEVPLHSGKTPALRFGAWIAGAWIAIGLAGLGLGVVSLAHVRRARLSMR